MEVVTHKIKKKGNSHFSRLKDLHTVQREVTLTFRPTNLYVAPVTDLSLDSTSFRTVSVGTSTSVSAA